MGTHDAPALIDHILEVTGNTNLTYLGHSQGTTMLMAGASLLPDYFNLKLNGAILLAPPATLFHNP
jgi:lysosomal acid lipase/cholesteryl ester hydrolase